LNFETGKAWTVEVDRDTEENGINNSPNNRRASQKWTITLVKDVKPIVNKGMDNEFGI